MTTGPDIKEVVGALLRSSNLKLGQGVVGRTGQVALGVIVTWSLLIWRMTESLYLDSALAFVGLVVTIFAGWYIKSTHQFAHENPALALLDGAEFVAYRQMEMAAAASSPEELKRVSDSPQARLSDRSGADEN